jgi:hypothetical protein
MNGYYFRAPTLFEPAAVPSDALRDRLHGARGMADILARSEKFARWLKARMTERGLDTGGPFIDEGGWILQTASEGGFVVCDVSAGGSGDDESLFYMLISRFKGATEHVGGIVEAILKESPEIEALEMKLA